MLSAGESRREPVTVAPLQNGPEVATLKSVLNQQLRGAEALRKKLKKDKLAKAASKELREKKAEGGCRLQIEFGKAADVVALGSKKISHRCESNMRSPNDVKGQLWDGI